MVCSRKKGTVPFFQRWNYGQMCTKKAAEAAFFIEGVSSIQRNIDLQLEGI